MSPSRCSSWYARTGRPAADGVKLGRALELRPLARRDQHALRGAGAALPLAEGAGAPSAWLALQATGLLQRWGLRFDASPVPRWPFWTQVVVFLLVSDVLQWCVHNLLHRVPFLWTFHKVHHAITTMDFVGNFRFHWVEIVGEMAWPVGRMSGGER